MGTEAEQRAQSLYRIRHKEQLKEKSKLYNRKRRLDKKFREQENRSRIRLPEVPFYLDITEEEAIRMEQVWKVTCPMHYQSCTLGLSNEY